MFEELNYSSQTVINDWSPGLVVMDDNSFSKGCGFESRRCVLDGHLDIFSHRFVIKIVWFV